MTGRCFYYEASSKRQSLSKLSIDDADDDNTNNQQQHERLMTRIASTTDLDSIFKKGRAEWVAVRASNVARMPPPREKAMSLIDGWLLLR
jgi:hypothetical protein